MENKEKKRKKVAPIVCAAVMVGLLLIYLVAMVYPVLTVKIGNTMAIISVLISAAVLLALIGGILLALRQRLKEIEGGEEEDAKKY